MGGKSGRTLPTDPLCRAARRLLFVTRARHTVRLGVLRACEKGSAVGSAVPCGSASPVRYQSSAYRAARHFACENRREPDLGFRCGSASPVCYLISGLGAAGRFQRGALDFSNPVLGAARRSEPDWNRYWNRDLGFGCGSASPVCSPITVLGAARRLLFVT